MADGEWGLIEDIGTGLGIALSLTPPGRLAGAWATATVTLVAIDAPFGLSGEASDGKLTGDDIWELSTSLGAGYAATGVAETAGAGAAAAFGEGLLATTVELISSA